MCEMRIPGEVISVGIHFLNRAEFNLQMQQNSD